MNDRREHGGLELAGTTPPQTHTFRALVLDDDAGALRAVSRSLESRSFSVVAAGDGTRGVELLLDELLGLDVVVLAANLPDRDARAFAHLVRDAGGERDLALVVSAREPTVELRDALLALGVDAVVDAADGSDAVARAALAAIVKRGSRLLDGDEPPARAPAAEPGAPGLAERIARSVTGEWSLAPAW